ncbi:MAG: YitT family protein [Lachnospiraceae bacterium]|nr:YitT family protein [Lachnospiraceae bacterium]
MKQYLKGAKPINFIILAIAGLINAFGVTVFLSPVGLYDSGISGTSMLLWQITPEYLTLSLFLIILNIPLFLFGLKKEGKLFTVYSVYAVCFYSLGAFLITNVFPVDVSVSSPIAGTDLLLCSIFGGLISGIGSGLTIRFGGAIDGIEVMAVIFAKRIGMTVGTFVMIYNLILYILIGCVRSSFILPMYSIITYYIALKTIDFIVEGFDKAKAAVIVTNREDQVCKALSDMFGKGMTVVKAKGYYSSEDKTAIYLVLNRFQIGKMKNIVKAEDEKAFITISEVSDVFSTNTHE